MTFLSNGSKILLLIYGFALVLFILGYIPLWLAALSTIIICGILLDASKKRRMWRWLCSLIDETEESMDAEIRKNSK